MPEVSVLMGIYNEKNKNTVKRAINSILNQTFRDFELVICDDGSMEAFYQWLVQYCRRDFRIVVLRNQENKGLAYALNRCLAYASGRFAARMDADDLAHPDRLWKQVSFLRRHRDYAMVGCCAYLRDAHGIWGVRWMEEEPEKKSFLSTSAFIHPAVMFRMDVLRRLRGYCESGRVRRAEDYDLFMRAYAAGFRGYNLQEVLLQYQEDRKSYQKRKYRYRVTECFVRLMGFKRLGILKGNIRYVLKPLAAGLVPANVAYRLRRRRFARPAEANERGRK